MAREDMAPDGPGLRLVVQCDSPGCSHAVVMDPRPIFGSRRDWPPQGRSARFRCQCGSRVSAVSYTRNDCLPSGPLSRQVISLWA
jgi:hypothetical protein